MNLIAYIVIGIIFYIVVYVKQPGVEKLEREWIRCLLIVSLYPLIFIVAVISTLPTIITWFISLLKWKN